MNRALLKKLFPLTTRALSTKKSFKQVQEEISQLPIFDYDSPGKDRNRVFVCGNVKTGALGVKYTKRKNLVQSIRAPKRLGFAERHRVLSVACGFGFTIYSVDDGDEVKIYGNGLNTDSQIGRHETPQRQPLEVVFFPQPIALPFKNPRMVEVIKVSAGRSHVAVLTNEGLYLFGNNSYGQCGRKIVQNEDYFNSQHVNVVENLDGSRITDVSCGQDHTVATTEDGRLFSCGWGADGQTGLRHFDSTEIFTKVQGDVKGERIVKVSCRSDFVMALNDRGEVFGWGNTEYAQLRTRNNEQQVCVPTRIGDIRSLGKIKDVATSGTSCLVLNESGDVFAWGFGILGTGPNVQHSETPVLIPRTLFGRNEFNSDSSVVRIECGLSHYAAVTNRGDLYTWGRNREGCLGLGHLNDQYFPLKVSLAGHVKQISCGLDHTVAICESFIADVNKS